MTEQWWIDCDWEGTFSGMPEFGFGTVNLAQLASIYVYEERKGRWEVRGTYNRSSDWLIIRVYANKDNALATLALLRQFLYSADKDKHFICLRELRLRLEEVGKC